MWKLWIELIKTVIKDTIKIKNFKDARYDIRQVLKAFVYITLASIVIIMAHRSIQLSIDIIKLKHTISKQESRIYSQIHYIENLKLNNGVLQCVLDSEGITGITSRAPHACRRRYNNHSTITVKGAISEL